MRAQTTLDFAIGVTLFLTVMLFVFAFVPGIIEPFELSGEQDTVVSERLASRLSQSTLAEPGTPFVLDTICAVGFFDDGAPSPPSCDYDGSDVHERLRLAEHRGVNVSLEGTLSGSEGELVCWDDPGERLVESSDGACDQVLASGGVPPAESEATVTSRRVVSLNRENLTLKVVVW